MYTQKVRHNSKTQRFCTGKMDEKQHCCVWVSCNVYFRVFRGAKYVRRELFPYNQHGAPFLSLEIR